MARILVTEKIADSGLDRLRRAGHTVDVRLDLDPAGLIEAVRGAHALIIRSATQVTAEVLEAGTDLVVVGRAGIGLDNVDVAAATARGVMVVNAPRSNTLSAAEHTIALLLAQARNIPQAHAALVAGRWERSRWTGVELADKTLGIVGLGRIGTLVAQRALAFGMTVIAHDPFVAAERARRLNVELVDLDTLVARADFVTLHVAKTPETIGLVGKDLLARAKPGIRIVNVARGGIVDEEALAEAIREGRVAGAALDVFATEPCTDSPLFELEQVELALAGEFVPVAVNVDAAEVSETLRPYLPLCELLGALFAGLVAEDADGSRLPATIDVEFRGEIGEHDTSLATLSALRGLLSRITDEPVSYVNARTLAAERGIEVRAISAPTAHDRLNLVVVRGGDHSIGGTLQTTATGVGEPRLVLVDDHTVELRPSRHMLVVRNEDRPGMVGVVGRILGDAGINISAMHIGESNGVAAMMVIATDVPVPPEVRQALRAQDGIESVRVLDGR
ncbi:MAG: phosphoglycerate dehydrogenase [Actinomyces sp.]|nr:MAG: phosphoglycerate dehydrogenase [Actinomyces sp.]